MKAQYLRLFFVCSSIIESIGVWVCVSNCTLGWGTGGGVVVIFGTVAFLGCAKLFLLPFTVFQSCDNDLLIFAGVRNL